VHTFERPDASIEAIIQQYFIHSTQDTNVYKSNVTPQANQAQKGGSSRSPIRTPADRAPAARRGSANVSAIKQDIANSRQRPV
jgi:hypothetical protein